MTTRLGSVLDRDEPSTEGGPSGRLTIDVLDTWLEPHTALEIVVPTRLMCARCEGGGCDACGRSGAIRIQGSEEERRLRITLSESARGLRLVRPLGAEAGLDQLILEFRPAAAPSELCHRVETVRRRPSMAPLVVVVLALVAAIIAALVVRR